MLTGAQEVPGGTQEEPERIRHSLARAYANSEKHSWHENKTDLCVLQSTEAKRKRKRFAKGTAHLREQTTRPCLRRLTRRVLQVAESLPWPVKDGLSRTDPQPTLRAVNTGHQVFWRGRS